WLIGIAGVNVAMKPAAADRLRWHPLPERAERRRRHQFQASMFAGTLVTSAGFLSAYTFLGALAFVPIGAWVIAVGLLNTWAVSGGQRPVDLPKPERGLRRKLGAAGKSIANWGQLAARKTRRATSSWAGLGRLVFSHMLLVAVTGIANGMI